MYFKSPTQVRPPTAITRVSEHIEEVIKFVERLIENQYAYTTPDGSVYFDTVSYGSRYGKLQPERQTSSENQQQQQPNEFKKNVKDFALWKASTEETTTWPSPNFGGSKRGRPGWHIECSAMSRFGIVVILKRYTIYRNKCEKVFFHFL